MLRFSNRKSKLDSTLSTIVRITLITLAIFAAFFLTFSLTSCASGVPVVPVAPNSPQTEVLHINATFSEAIRLAVTTAISLRDQKTISVDDTKAVEKWSLEVLNMKDSIDTELGSGDTWIIQKQKILLSLAGFKSPAVTSNPILQATLSSVLLIVQQIQNRVN